MPSSDQIQLLMEELGPAMDEVTDILREADTSWTIALEDETVIGLDLVAEQEKLVLSTELGEPPEERRAFCNEFFMVYNFNWVQSGGVKIGLESPNGEYVMMFELNAAGLSLQTLQMVIANMARQSLAWRELIALGMEGATSPESGFENDLTMAAIRV